MKTELVTFGGGCFWCVETIFERMKGVIDVQSGYAGGNSENPTYKEICTGLTNHAEVVQIKYNPQEVKFEELLEIFFAGHDPTTLNRQGADVGTQYRSVVFYHTESQKLKAEIYIAKLEKEGEFDNSITTQIKALDKFYLAEDYHQDYYINNMSQPYCSAVIAPKIKKIEEKFKDRLKD